MTPTQRTIRILKDRGMPCAIVEKFNAHIGPHGVRQDMFGIIDVVALDSELTIGVQSCGNSYAQHLKKFKEERYQECCDWLSSPYRTLELWAWRKVKAKRGGKAMVWRPRVLNVTIEELNK